LWSHIAPSPPKKAPQEHFLHTSTLCRRYYSARAPTIATLVGITTLRQMLRRCKVCKLVRMIALLKNTAFSHHC
jgi:hypothetical protein